MKLGNKILLILIFFWFNISSVFPEERISTSPLLNLEKIKPSFEELEIEKEKKAIKKKIKRKKKNR